MKRIRIIALLLFLGLLLGGCARTALETGSWGLSFPGEGESPVGNASSEELRQYDAAFMGNPEEKTLYLTFDLGYEGGYTAQILDTLKEKHVPAAFFVVGTYVEQNPELIRHMADEGHTVGNHTYHHWDMSKIGDEATFSSELQAVADAYQAATGQEMTKYYRPPQGIFSEESLLEPRLCGLAARQSADRRRRLRQASSAHAQRRRDPAARNVRDERAHSLLADRQMDGAGLPVWDARRAVRRGRGSNRAVKLALHAGAASRMQFHECALDAARTMKNPMLPETGKHGAK